jgi:hypothetical protein
LKVLVDGLPPASLVLLPLRGSLLRPLRVLLELHLPHHLARACHITTILHWHRVVWLLPLHTHLAICSSGSSIPRVLLLVQVGLKRQQLPTAALFRWLLLHRGLHGAATALEVVLLLILLLLLLLMHQLRHGLTGTLTMLHLLLLLSELDDLAEGLPVLQDVRDLHMLFGSSWQEGGGAA